MLVSFHDIGAEDVYNGRDTRKARRACPVSLWRVAQRKLSYMAEASELRDLKAPPRNQLEALTGARAGQHSIRINDQYRICFRWTPQGAAEVEIVDYHR